MGIGSARRQASVCAVADMRALRKNTKTVELPKVFLKQQIHSKLRQLGYGMARFELAGQ